jgi:hypothetical protein
MCPEYSKHGHKEMSVVGWSVYFKVISASLPQQCRAPWQATWTKVKRVKNTRASQVGHRVWTERYWFHKRAKAIVSKISIGRREGLDWGGGYLVHLSVWHAFDTGVIRFEQESSQELAGKNTHLIANNHGPQCVHNIQNGKMTKTTDLIALFFFCPQTPINDDLAVLFHCSLLQLTPCNICIS